MFWYESTETNRPTRVCDVSKMRKIKSSSLREERAMSKHDMAWIELPDDPTPEDREEIERMIREVLTG